MNILTRLRELAQRPQMQKLASNVSWVAVANIGDIVFSMVIGIIIARILGAGPLGVWSLAIAYYSIVQITAMLALDQVTLVDVSANTQKSGVVFSTSIVIKLATHLLSAAVLFVLSLDWLQVDTQPVRDMLRVLVFAIALSPFDLIAVWYRGSENFRQLGFITLGVSVFVGVLRIWMMLAGLPIIWLAYSMVLQVILQQAVLAVFLPVRGVRFSLSEIRWDYAKSLLRFGTPLMLSSLAVVFYMRVNILVLARFESEDMIGQFSAASRIVQLTYFLPTFFVTAVTPMLYRLYRENQALFLVRIRNTLFAFNAILIASCIFTTIFAVPITTLVFGKAFIPGGHALAVYIWTAVPVAQGSITSIWLMAAGNVKALTFRTIIGAVANLVFTLLLVPPFGIVGGAWAAVLGFSVAGLGAHFVLGGQARSVLALQLQSFLPRANLLRWIRQK